MIPTDSDGDAMRRVLSQGSDPTRPMMIDFHVAVPSEPAGQAVAAAAKAKQYAARLDRDQKTGKWTCCCSRTMQLDYDGLRRSQHELSELSAPFGGYSDGWGTFGNATPG